MVWCMCNAPVFPIFTSKESNAFDLLHMDWAEIPSALGAWYMTTAKPLSKPDYCDSLGYLLTANASVSNGVWAHLAAVCSGELSI